MIIYTLIIALYKNWHQPHFGELIGSNANDDNSPKRKVITNESHQVQITRKKLSTWPIMNNQLHKNVSDVILHPKEVAKAQLVSPKSCLSISSH